MKQGEEGQESHKLWSKSRVTQVVMGLRDLDRKQLSRNYRDASCRDISNSPACFLRLKHLRSYFGERRAPENETKERNGSAATHRSAKWCSAGRWVSTFYLVPWVAVCRLFNKCHTMVIELSFATHGTVTFSRSDRPSSSSTTACCKEGISSIISSIPCLL
jgi:hypothetical protein